MLRDLEEQHFLEKAVPHKHAVPVCVRTDEVDEPMLTDQWFRRLDAIPHGSRTSIARQSDRRGPRLGLRSAPARYVTRDSTRYRSG